MRGIATGSSSGGWSPGHCETIRARVREGMRTISIRIVDQGWDGLRRTHAEDSHRQRPFRHHFQRGWNRHHRPCVARRHVPEVGTDVGGTLIVAFCASLVCNTFTLQQREESKGTLQCFGSSPSAYRAPWKKWQPCCSMENSCACFWTTSTSCAQRSG